MDALSRLSACFLIGVTGPGWTSDGNALLASVSDDPYDIRTFLRLIHATGKLDHIGTELTSTTEHSLTQRGYFARPGETTRGINQAGLAFTCAMIIEDKQYEQPAHRSDYADITDQIMRTCKNVTEALYLFQSAAAVKPSYTVLLADADGNLAQIEVGSFGIEILHQYSKENPGVVLSVNCYQSESLVVFNDPVTLLSNPQNNNSARLERGRVLADQYHGNINIHTISQVLSDHANKGRDPLENPVLNAWGYSICNHGTRNKGDYPHEDLPWGTVSSEIMQPSARRFWYSYGWPCGERPAYGDQIYQEKSWGKFLPFSFNPTQANGQGIEILTTVDGNITPGGARYLDFTG